MNELYPQGLAARAELVRPLGSVERLFWLLDQKHPVHFAVAAEIEGRTDVGDWLEALDRVQARHPMLSVSIDARPGGAPRFRRDLGAAIPLRVIVSADPSARWKGEVAAELAARFDPARPPLARAVLIHAPDSAVLIMTAHHAIGDGLSLAYAIRDVLSTLGGEGLEARPLPASQDELLDAFMMAEQPDTAAKQENGSPAISPGVFRAADGARPEINGVLFDRAATTKLRERARREATTVHAAIVTAFADSVRRIAPTLRDAQLRVISPVNSRPVVGSGEDVILHISATNSFVESDEAGFWERARAARPALARGQSREGVCGFVSVIQQAIHTECDVVSAAEFASVAFAGHALISNLGSLDFGPRFGPLQLKAMWGPSVLAGMEGEQVIGVATVDDVLTLIHTSHSPHAGLLDTMQDVLLEACA